MASPQREDLTDHDRLIRLDEIVRARLIRDTSVDSDSVVERKLLTQLDMKVDAIAKNLANHLKHHWAVTIGITLAVLGALISAILALVMK